MHIQAPPEQVFDLLDSDQGRACFWAESAVMVDDVIEFRFSNGYVHRSKVLVRDRPRFFVIEYMGGPVRFELIPDGAGGTDLLLIHDGVAPEEWIETHAG